MRRCGSGGLGSRAAPVTRPHLQGPAGGHPGHLSREGRKEGGRGEGGRGGEEGKRKRRREGREGREEGGEGRRREGRGREKERIGNRREGREMIVECEDKGQPEQMETEIFAMTKCCSATRTRMELAGKRGRGNLNREGHLILRTCGGVTG